MRRIAVAAAAVGLLGLAACGSSSGGDSFDATWEKCKDAAVELAGNPTDVEFLGPDRESAAELRSGGWAIVGGLRSSTISDAFLCTAEKGKPVKVVWHDQ